MQHTGTPSKAQMDADEPSAKKMAVMHAHDHAGVKDPDHGRNAYTALGGAAGSVNNSVRF